MLGICPRDMCQGYVPNLARETIDGVFTADNTCPVPCVSFCAESVLNVELPDYLLPERLEFRASLLRAICRAG